MMPFDIFSRHHLVSHT